MEIFNDKKILSAEIFLHVITKNLNWEILAKSLVTFKRWDGVKMKNFIIWVYRKIKFLRGEGGFHEKPIYRGGLPEGCGVFEGWVDAPMHTMTGIL